MIPDLATTKAHESRSTSCSKIMTGDVVEILSQQPKDVKFDVVIADPPYNIGKDFGNNQDKMPIDKYVAWCREWLEKCFQLLRQNGLIYMYGFPEVLSRIAATYPIEKQKWLAWHYTNKAVPSSRFWQRSHESILCLWHVNEKRPALEVDQIREPYTDHFLKCKGRIRKPTSGRFSHKGTATTYTAHEKGALPRDVICVPALAGGAGRSERWFMCLDCGGEVKPPARLKEHRDHHILKHPTQKPMALSQRLIRSRINATQGRALIPFAGSGSECIVAKRLGIEFLGIEINPTYAQFGRSWLKQCID